MYHRGAGVRCRRVIKTLLDVTWLHVVHHNTEKTDGDGDIMGEVRWTEVFVVTLLLLPVTEVAAFLSSVTVRDGADVTLSCENVRVHQDGCDNTTWVFTDYTSEATVALSDHGKINKDAGDKWDRLRVTEDCSLVIEKVSADDAGLYNCRQLDTEEDVVLSVVTMTTARRVRGGSKGLQWRVLSEGWHPADSQPPAHPAPLLPV
ncbi:hypothetical protein INR49_010449 [Caranx melampygus]|nr:hypothetical protein INR49_010449 [Caranx melampygus]